MEARGGTGKAGGRGDGRALDKEAIHDTRKALKRLRALVRLLRAELGEQRYKREHAILRDAARRLAGARDAEVMVGTLDALLERHPRELGRRRPADRAAQAARRRTRRGGASGARRSCDARGGAARAGRPARAGPAVGAARTARHRPRRARPAADLPRRARARAPRRAREGRRRARAHEWRKRVKDLRYAAEILDQRPLARRADELAELLGEEHDLVVLAGLLPRAGRAPFKGKRGRRARKALLARIARRRRRLRKRALREGERLYARAPKKFVRRVSRAHAHALRK